MADSVLQRENLMKRVHVTYWLIGSLLIATLAYAEFTRDSMTIGLLTLDPSENAQGIAGTPLTIQTMSGQTASIIDINDGSANDLLTLWHSGHLQTIEGFRTTTPHCGPGLWIHLYGEDTPEHTNGTGSYDHTGGAYENYFTATAGDAFTQADADNGSWILLTGSKLGAVAEIKSYIDATHVTVDGMGWTGDIASQGYLIYRHPTFVSGDGAKHEFSVEAGGEFEIHSYNFTGSKMVEISNDVASDSADTLHIEHEANGYANGDAIQLFYETGATQAVDELQAIQISVDETGATAGQIDLIYLETTDATAMEKHAIHISTGFDRALTVSGVSSKNQDYGYEYTAGAAPVDRVKSAGAGNNAYINPAIDEQIFDAANDFILIGDDDQFEVIEVVLATVSSKDLDFEYYYSDNTNGTDIGVAGWTQFYPDDSTEGFKKSGLIDWTAWGAAWDEDDLAEAGEAITEGYYIAIKRTRIGGLTEPIEDFFKIYEEQGGDTGMIIKGDGRIKLPYLTGAPGSLENGDIWMEADGLHVYYGAAEHILTD